MIFTEILLLLCNSAFFSLSSIFDKHRVSINFITIIHGFSALVLSIMQKKRIVKALEIAAISIYIENSLKNSKRHYFCSVSLLGTHFAHLPPFLNMIERSSKILFFINVFWTHTPSFMQKIIS